MNNQNALSLKVCELKRNLQGNSLSKETLFYTNANINLW